MSVKWPAQGATWHVAGIGGVGMNALAQLLLAMGWKVTGSDRLIDQGVETPILTRLKGMGVVFHPQDGSGLSQATAGWVASSAVETDNPERRIAQSLGIPLWHRAGLLAALAEGRQCIAVAGTSGKTTVTGMMGWVLTELGADPTMVNGGGVLNWRDPVSPGNVRLGKSALWVIETDESDRSLLRFSPDISLLTNISRDHFPLEETIALFREFVRKVKTHVFAPPEVLELLDREPGIEAECIPVKAPDALDLLVPGEHNRKNAAMVYTACRSMGFSDDKIRSALSRFQGIERRLECVGAGRGVAVYDEYAHNPAKIKAAWTAIAERHAPVLGVWRPHGYGPLASMASELTALFKDMCRAEDRLFILPVYYSGGTAQRTLSGAAFVDQLRAAGVSATYAASYHELESPLLSTAKSGGAILIMGARDPELPVFARDVAKQLNSFGGI